jgi:hypothetical protein
VSTQVTNDWTSQENAILRQERLLAEVLKTRKGTADWRAWVKDLFSTPVLVVVCTAAATLLGQFLSARQSVEIAYKQEVLKEQVNTVKQAYASAGDMLSAAQYLVALGDATGENEDLQKERDARTKQFNEAQTKWTTSRLMNGYLLYFYTGGSTTIRNDWKSAADAIDACNDCAVKMLQKIGCGNQSPTQLFDAASTTLEGLGRHLAEATQISAAAGSLDKGTKTAAANSGGH